MPRKKGTRNTPQSKIDEIVAKHQSGATLKSLSEEYGKPFKTIKNMCTRENNKDRCKEAGLLPTKKRGRKAAVSLQEYKYENKRLKMENELLRDFFSRRKGVKASIKYRVIHKYRSKYSVSTMCSFFGVSRSGYYDFVKRIELRTGMKH